VWNIALPWNRVLTSSMSIFQTSCEHMLVVHTVCAWARCLTVQYLRAFYTNFAQRKFGNGKRTISFPFPFPRGCMFYTFSGAEEIGNGNSASSSHGFTDASRSRPFLWQNDTYRRFLPRLRCAAVLTQLIMRAVMNMSTSNNRRLILQLRCRDLDPRTKGEFCGLVVQALVESDFEGFETDDGQTRVAQLGQRALRHGEPPDCAATRVF
jgi:hypothetical protein